MSDVAALSIPLLSELSEHHVRVIIQVIVRLIIQIIVQVIIQFGL